LVLRTDVIIAVGAHPDDIELGCGGTVRAATKAGKKVIAVIMTKGEQSANPEIRCEETKKALYLLGVKEVHFGDFPDTEVPSSRKAVSFLEGFYDKQRPETILTHSVNSMHQDHRQVGWLSMAAYRFSPRILAYETPRVTSSFSPTYYIDISDCIEEKCAALKCHCSQKTKTYIQNNSVVNMAAFRGHQVNVAYAEAFEVVRYVEKPQSNNSVINIES
jgi:LmbE family N-acetylglucosaminyl deacetylase